MSSQENITQLLIELSNGKRSTIDDLLPVVYDEMKRMAAGYLRRERANHTLQPTALVHEAYLRLVDQQRVSWQNRAHFCGVAAQVMRRVLLQHARAHHAAKRGGGLQKIYLDETRELAQKDPPDLIALDDALKSLPEFIHGRARSLS